MSHPALFHAKGTDDLILICVLMIKLLRIVDLGFSLLATNFVFLYMDLQILGSFNQPNGFQICYHPEVSNIARSCLPHPTITPSS